MIGLLQIIIYDTVESIAQAALDWAEKKSNNIKGWETDDD